jgi:hypothetical protein
MGIEKHTYNIYIYMDKFHHDLTVQLFTEPWNHGKCLGNHPQMAARFRLVKYYNLPRSLRWFPLVMSCFSRPM